MGSLLTRIKRAQEVALCVVRKWWRPLVCVGMGGSLIANGIILPLITHTAADLTGLAALCGSLAPFAWLRTVEKKAGVSTENLPGA